MADRDSDDDDDDVDDSEGERCRLVNEIGWQGQQNDHGNEHEHIEHEHEHDVERGGVYPAGDEVDVVDGAGIGVSPSGDCQEGGNGKQVTPGSR